VRIPPIFTLSSEKESARLIAKLDRMNTRLAANLGLLITALIWGSTFSITKVALADVDPTVFLFTRFCAATASLVLSCLARILIRPSWIGAVRSALAESIKPGIVLGSLCLFASR